MLPVPKYSFVVWGPSTGCGKSTLTAHLACEYALQFPDWHILVVDMTPTSSCTEKLISARREIPFEKSTTGWLTGYASALSAGSITKYLKKQDVDEWLEWPGRDGSRVPGNVCILAGHESSEVFTMAVEHGLLSDLTSGVDPQYCNHHALRAFVSLFSEKYGAERCAVFIDVPSAFTAQTRVGFCSAQRLICPFNYQASNVKSTSVLLKLMRSLHGDGDERDPGGCGPPAHSFSHAVQKLRLSMPVISVLVANRWKRGDKKWSISMQNDVLDPVSRMHDNYPSMFLARAPVQASVLLNKVTAFQQLYVPSVLGLNFMPYISSITHASDVLGLQECAGSIPEGVRKEVSGQLSQYLWTIQNLLVHLHGDVKKFVERTVAGQICLTPVPAPFFQRRESGHGRGKKGSGAGSESRTLGTGAGNQSRATVVDLTKEDTPVARVNESSRSSAIDRTLGRGGKRPIGVAGGALKASPKRSEGPSAGLDALSNVVSEHLSETAPNNGEAGPKQQSHRTSAVSKVVDLVSFASEEDHESHMPGNRKKRRVQSSNA